MSANLITPVHVEASEAAQWQSAHSIAFDAARLWNKYAPRGKGAVPRLIGKLFENRLKVFITTAGGARLAVTPSSLDVYVHISNHGGLWNEHVFQTCASLLIPGDVFWDVGANVGVMSIEMAKRFQGRVQVYSFEPQPVLSRAIAISAFVNRFGSLTVYDVMLGEMDGETELFVGSHGIHASARPRENRSRRIARRVVAIDSLMQSGEVMPPNVIKMDIEGGELSALRGARLLISKHKPHIVFEADENMKRFGYEREDVLRFLAACASYNFYFIQQNGALIPLTSSNLNAPYSDILATTRLLADLVQP